MDNKIIEALKQDQFIELLRGDYPYYYDIYANSINVLPTNVEQVVTEIYQTFLENSIIREQFILSLEMMIDLSAADFYLALQYVDTCLFREHIGRASFAIGIERLSLKIKEGYNKFKNELSKEIIFANGLVKKNPLKNILDTNQFFLKKYGFSIL